MSSNDRKFPISKDIPELKEIIKEAVSRVEPSKDFSMYVNKIEKEAHKIYLEYEKEAIKKSFLDLIADFISELSTSIANTRRSRGGKSSEYIISFALERLGIPNEVIGNKKNKNKSYYPDIAIPSYEEIEKGNGIALAIKRTLRERWREDTSIFKYKKAAFVCLSDSSDITESKLLDMEKEGIKVLFLEDSLFRRYKNAINNLKQMEVYPLSKLPEWIESKLNE
jgi:hypothetical protein